MAIQALPQNYVQVRVEKLGKTLMIWGIILLVLSVLLAIFWEPLSLILTIPLTGWMAYRGYARMNNYKLHSAFKKLDKLGADSEKVETLINAEVQNDLIAQFDSLVITNHFMIEDGSMGWSPHLLEEVMWIYVNRTVHKTYGVKTGESFAVSIHTLRKHIQISGTKDVVDKMIMQLAVIVPGIWLGYSEERNKLWNKDKDACIKQIQAEKAAAKQEAGGEWA